MDTAIVGPNIWSDCVFAVARARHEKRENNSKVRTTPYVGYGQANASTSSRVKSNPLPCTTLFVSRSITRNLPHSGERRFLVGDIRSARPLRANARRMRRDRDSWELFIGVY
ncbi:MAG: hypothetical protein ACXV8A_03995 [Chthoniobacterales bacterium]